ncbi:hypothetical protein PULV_a2185 [Pseudoalteromonas ulvae UL12]|nr:hypothetical protein [Pseudoalteromonas ulvae UL12]
MKILKTIKPDKYTSTHKRHYESLIILVIIIYKKFLLD